MGKTSKCSNFNFHEHSGTVLFWGFIVLLFVLVVGNFVLTLTIISFFKIGMGMESIKLNMESRTIKFFGSTDFNKVYKKDGLIDGFRDTPTLIQGDDNYLKINLVDRKGHSTNRFMMGSNGTEFKGINFLQIKDPTTNQAVFTSTNKLKYNLAKETRNLEATVVYAAHITSPIDKKLEIQSKVRILVSGIEGTKLDAKEIFMSAEQNIVFDSNSSIQFAAQSFYIDADRVPIAPLPVRPNSGQYKLCACYPKGIIYRVSLAKLHNNKDACKHIKPDFCA
ncbi:unnamed protein product [Diamesa serratosioi]